jgi:hypothetical protein
MIACRTIRICGGKKDDETNLPPSYDCEIHRRIDLIVSDRLEGLPLVPDDRTELFDCASLDRDLRSMEGLADVDIRKSSIVAVPELPIELFDARVAARRNLMDGREPKRRLVLELKRERNRDVPPILENRDVNKLRRSRELDLYGLERGLVVPEGTRRAVNGDRRR